MIIKSLSRKTRSFQQLLDYINQPKEKGPSFAHNLRSDPEDTALVHREFLDNARYLPQRKNGNVLYHEIISFHRADRDKLEPAVIEDLARRYLERRAQRALAYARIHYDTDHVHVHLLISANELDTTKRLRLSRGEFKSVVHEIELYQARQYPFLKESVAIDVDLKAEKARRNGKRMKSPAEGRQTRKERERGMRLRREGRKEPSRREVLKTRVLEQISQAPTFECFLKQLGHEGYELYVNRRRIGIRNLETKVKHRLSTLGVLDEFNEAFRYWRRTKDRMARLQQVESFKTGRVMVEFGYRADVEVVLGSPALTDEERSRIEAIGRTYREKRRRTREDKERPI